MRVAVAVVVLAQLATAWADAGDEELAREHAKSDAAALAHDGRRFSDPQRLLDCGQAYIDIYNRNPTAPDFEAVLVSGAQCYDDARAVGSSIMLYNMLARYGAQSSPNVAKALSRLGTLFQQVGMLDKAAGHLEKLGTTFPNDKGAKDALLEAIRIRTLLDQDRELHEATTKFEQWFGLTDGLQAAELALASAAGYRGGRGDKMKFLRLWVTKYGDRVGPELTARAFVELGELLWQQACPGRDGLCIVVTRGRPLPIAARAPKVAATAEHCGPAAESLELVPRDPKTIATALSDFAEAERRLAKLPRPTAAAQQIRARIRFVQADRALEAFLALAPGDPAKATRATAVAAAYSALEPAFGSRATARLGQLWQLYATQVTTAPIPAAVRAGGGVAGKIDAYCATQAQLAVPLVKRAVDLYDACAARMSQLGVIDPSTQQCEREGGSLAPASHAITQEVLPDVVIPAPVSEELPIQPGANQRQIYKDALRELASVIDQPSIPTPKCEAIAKAFAAVAKVDPRPEVHVMAGLTYGRCNQIANAKAAYDAALKLDPKDPFAISNLGELEYRAGNFDAALARWDSAIKLTQKLYGARLGLAALELQAVRAPPLGSARSRRADDALYHAANAAAIAPTRNAPFVVMALVALEQSQPAIAAYFATRGSALAPSPVLELVHARALAAAGDAGALAALATAAASNGDAGALALGLHQLAVRRYADAAATLAPIKTTSYELTVARGIAARGQGKLADADAQYSAAIALDASRPEAHFNLGVLYKDYSAARTQDPKAAKAALAKAAASFRKADASDLADDCDRAAALW